MTDFPETRASLILRIADAGDAQAWDEFVRLYHPIVYRLGRRQGMQHADAEELGQEVMLAVARAAERWVPDHQRGRFRHWLLRIARNMIINFLTRRKHQTWGSGDSAVQSMLEGQPDEDGALSRRFEIEYRRAVFQLAAKQVQIGVTGKSWLAFWWSTIDDVPIAEVAQQLEMSVGAVYIARNRVVARLRREVRRIEADESLVDESEERT